MLSSLRGLKVADEQMIWTSGAGSIRQQDGQGSICQDMLGCPAEYHLPQSALRVGTLDQKVTAQ
jgi:hypothetical protein